MATQLQATHSPAASTPPPPPPDVRLVSLGPDCGLKYAIEGYLHGGRHIQSELFDWVQVGLLGMALVLEHLADELPYFGVSTWRHMAAHSTASHHVYEHEPTGMRSVHDAPSSKYASWQEGRDAVSSRYETRRRRLCDILTGGSSATTTTLRGCERVCCMHIVDTDNVDNPQPLPDREAVARVVAALLQLGAAELVILADGAACTTEELSMRGVTFMDLRGFLRDGAGDVSKSWRREQYEWKRIFAQVAEKMSGAR